MFDQPTFQARPKETGQINTDRSIATVVVFLPLPLAFDILLPGNPTPMRLSALYLSQI
jgi:hypothetical protein